jgi:mRNA-degrading endonuclease RelE of RelBE toxin-antitoxin system
VLSFISAGRRVSQRGRIRRASADASGRPRSWQSGRRFGWRSETPLGCPGRGKSGGYRVIYFVKRAPGVILMLTMYAKNVKDNIPGHLLAQIRKEVDDGD